MTGRGRFTTRDPLGLAAGPNLYAYVGNNPVNWVDPWGLKGTLRVNVVRGGGGSLSGHAWITYTDEGGHTQAFGTYGRTDIGIINLQENLELGITPDVSISAELTDSQEQVFLDYLTNPKENHWDYFDNCSDFAAGAWKAAGQKPLNNRNWFGLPNPNSLANAIEIRLKEQQSSLDFSTSSSSSPFENASVPEPATLALAGLGVAMVALRRTRKKCRKCA